MTDLEQKMEALRIEARENNSRLHELHKDRQQLLDERGVIEEQFERVEKQRRAELSRGFLNEPVTAIVRPAGDRKPFEIDGILADQWREYGLVRIPESRRRDIADRAEYIVLLSDVCEYGKTPAAMRLPVPFNPDDPDNAGDHFGQICPNCGAECDWLNVGKVHFVACHNCREFDCVGSNLLSSWKHESDETHRAHDALLRTYTERAKRPSVAHSAVTGPDDIEF